MCRGFAESWKRQQHAIDQQAADAAKSSTTGGDFAMTKVKTYPCKYGDGQCGNFESEKYPCVHGGGVACPSWRRLTDELICPNEQLRRRVQGCKGRADLPNGRLRHGKFKWKCSFQPHVEVKTAQKMLETEQTATDKEERQL